MLPTKGYFQDIECPYHDRSCGRPYCHFRHRKKPAETAEITAASDQQPADPIPTYKPTPKSELANKSHIPISYVPDLAFRPNRTPRKIKPTYNPTPLSILSSASKRDAAISDDNNDEHSVNVKEVQLNIASVEYNPLDVNTINFEDLSTEFNMIDDIIINSSQEEKAPVEPEAKTKKSSQPDKEKKTSSSSPKKSSSSSSRHSKDKKSKSSSSSHKSSSHDKHRKHSTSSSHHHKKSSSSKERERDRDKEKKSKSSSSSNKSKKVEIEAKHKHSSSEENIPNNVSEFEDDDEDETMLECFKIFNEYKPEERAEIMAEPSGAKSPICVGKKRIAHSNIETSSRSVAKVKHIVTPGQSLANRFKLAKLSQANKEQECIMNAVKAPPPSIKRPPPTLLEAARAHKVKKLAQSKPSCNVIDDIINSNTKKKISPVLNVFSIQKAKERIQLLTRKPNAVAKPQVKTIAQCQKGSRVAHVPEFSLGDIPDVLHAERSKLPVNVRTRFLTMIAEECGKLYLSKDDGYTRALNEEFSCYEKCKVLVTYRNSAMLAVNRLRKEIQERDRLGLGLIDSAESSTSKSSPFSGKSFYENVRDWVLTDSDLDTHGYPRESIVPGRAFIKNHKITVAENLDENQRRCCRCGKIYMVECDGRPTYREECIYHPLRKRTIRGEQKFLCCKQTDDTGCATSDTHVSEVDPSAQLEGYQTTMVSETEDDPKSFAVYALDCEMCYTTRGLELTRVTIVDTDCKTIYESLVKPLNPIIDYNTRFSGITKEQMDKTSTSILQIQANILHLCNSRTILVGHSLESDLKALKIVHGNIIDTAVLFPHKMGLPHKRALRVLASEYLKKIIQNDVGGHDSAEDAITCMELIKWKLKEDLKLRSSK